MDHLLYKNPNPNRCLKAATIKKMYENEKKGRKRAEEEEEGNE